MPSTLTPQSPTDSVGSPGDQFTDFDQLAAFFSGWKGRFEQLSTGRFQGTIRSARGHMARVVSAEFNQIILAQGESGRGRFSVYLVGTENAGALWHGRKLDPGHLVVHGPDSATDHRSGRRCSVLGLSLPIDVLERTAHVMQNATLDATLRSWAALAPPPDRIASVDWHLRRLLGLGTSGLATPEGRQLEQHCVQSLLRAVCPVSHPNRSDLSLPVRAALVRRAEELMRANLGEPVGAIDLCAELGVGDRTLRLAFRERYGVGPMVYYRALRLNAVRAALKAQPVGTVSEVAHRFGFHHLGNFAADYRRVFGELPSQTVRG